MNFYDFSGHEEFKSQRPKMYSKVHALILVYDCTLPSSVHNLVNWVKEASNYVGSSTQFFIVENKTDLVDERLISSEEGKLVAKLAKGEFSSVSAKTGEGLEELFQKVIEKVYYAFVKVAEPVVTNDMMKMYDYQGNDYHGGTV